MSRKSERRHSQGEQSRQKILSAALQLSSELGYDGTSIALVTELSGLPASSVYWYFKNKDELLAEVLEHSYNEWRKIGPRWSDDADSPSSEVLLKRFQEATASFEQRPEFWRMGLALALQRRRQEPAARKRYLAVREQSRLGVDKFWQRLLPSGVAHNKSKPVEEIVDEIGRFHLAGMDGIFVGIHSDPDWDTAWLTKTLARGLDVYIHKAAE